MNAVKSISGMLLVLFVLGTDPAWSQIVDPNPPIACDESPEGNDEGSYVEFSGTWATPGGTVRGRLEWEDVEDWIDGLFGLLGDIFGGGGGEDGGGGGTDGGTNGGTDGGGTQGGEGGTEGGTGTDGGEGGAGTGGTETPTDGQTPTGGGGDSGGATSSESQAGCSMIKQKKYYAAVEITGSNLLVTMARPKMLNVRKVHIAKPIELSNRMKQRAGLKGRWFLKTGTYTVSGNMISLQLVKRTA